MIKKFSYNKKEKLKSRKQLQRLFMTGKSFTVFPVKVFFQFVDEQDSVLKAGVGVSKKHFKKAVHRNRIKRLLREVYRTEKTVLLKSINSLKTIEVFFLYIDSSLPEYNLLQSKMKSILEQLANKMKSADEQAS